MMLTYIREKTAGALLPATQGRPTKAAAQTRQTVTQREHQGTATFADRLSPPQAENPNLSVSASRFQHKGLRCTDILSCNLQVTLQKS